VGSRRESRRFLRAVAERQKITNDRVRFFLAHQHHYGEHQTQCLDANRPLSVKTVGKRVEQMYHGINGQVAPVILFAGTEDPSVASRCGGSRWMRTTLIKSRGCNGALRFYYFGAKTVRGSVEMGTATTKKPAIISSQL